MALISWGTKRSARLISITKLQAVVLHYFSFALANFAISKDLLSGTTLGRTEMACR
jgi:hypothetical protein